MTLKEICKKARQLHETSGGLIDRSDFIAACKLSADPDLSSVVSSDDILKDFGVYDVTRDVKVVRPNPHLTGIIRGAGKNFTVTKLRMPVPPGGLSVLSANSLIWNPKSNGGNCHVYCEYSTLCWMRFLAVKELMHLHAGLFDIGLVAERKLSPLFLCVRSIHNAIPDLDADLDNETSAFYLAIEYMLPWSERDALLKVLSFTGASAGMTCDFLAAKCFFIPEYVIAHVTQKDHFVKGLNYLSLSRIVNEDMDKA